VKRREFITLLGGAAADHRPRRYVPAPACYGAAAIGKHKQVSPTATPF
jgi:hypothetical protein